MKPCGVPFPSEATVLRDPYGMCAATSPHIWAQAIGCAAMAILCHFCGLLHNPILAPAPLWLGSPICHTGGTDWVSGFRLGAVMGLVMLLVSLAPLRWSGMASIAGAVVAPLWLVGAGLLQVLILAGDQIAWRGAMGPPAIPHLLILALGMVAALTAPGRIGGRVQRTAFGDGAHCFVRCGPMMIAMMLTGTMSLPWIIAGGWLSQIEEAVGDRRLSRVLTWGVGLSAAAFIASTA